MFPQISNAKVREGIFNGPDIKKNLQMAGMLKSYMELCFWQISGQPQSAQLKRAG
jgi:hypothetical protein